MERRIVTDIDGNAYSVPGDMSDAQIQQGLRRIEAGFALPPGFELHPRKLTPNFLREIARSSNTLETMNTLLGCANSWEQERAEKVSKELPKVLTPEFLLNLASTLADKDEAESVRQFAQKWGQKRRENALLMSKNSLDADMMSRYVANLDLNVSREVLLQFASAWKELEKKCDRLFVLGDIEPYGTLLLECDGQEQAQACANAMMIHGCLVVSNGKSCTVEFRMSKDTPIEHVIFTDGSIPDEAIEKYFEEKCGGVCWWARKKNG